MSNPPAEQPGQGQDFTLFPGPDHMSLDRLSDATSSESTDISLDSPQYRAGDSPDALAAVFSSTSFQDTDKQQLLVQIAELQQQLQSLTRLKNTVDYALAASEDRCDRLRHECDRLRAKNKRLARSLSEAQQRCEDNKPRRFEYTDSGK